MNREQRRAAKRINLDEARKARAEKDGEPPVITLGGIDFKLPPAAPLAALVGFAEAQDGDLRGVTRAIRALFGVEADKALDLGLDLADLELVLDAYNDDDDEEDSGEASASGD